MILNNCWIQVETMEIFAYLCLTGSIILNGILLIKVIQIMNLIKKRSGNTYYAN